MAMDRALQDLVWHRAGHRCEYCQVPQDRDRLPFEIDHIIAEVHDGPTRANNTCLCCFACNSLEGSDLTSYDRQTRRITPLFNPRRHKWAMHFRWEGPHLVGRTAIGRVTVTLLHINDEYRVELRETLMDEGLF
jgi:hypothetical protein